MKKILLFVFIITFSISLFSKEKKSTFNNYINNLKKFGAKHKITKESYDAFLKSSKTKIKTQSDNIKSQISTIKSNANNKFVNYKDRLSSKIKSVFNIDIVKPQQEVSNIEDRILVDITAMEQVVHETKLKDAKSRYMLANLYYLLSESIDSNELKEKYLQQAKFHFVGAYDLNNKFSSEYPENSVWGNKAAIQYNSIVGSKIKKAAPKSQAPKKTEVVKKSQKKISSDCKISSTGYVLPSSSGRISSSYGYRSDPFTKKTRYHKGIDIGIPTGTKLYSVDNAVVEFSGWMNGYGNVVVLRASNGDKIYYAHNKSNLVKKGDKINAGTNIALANSTGRSTGSHLHFEVRRNGKSIDPKYYLGSQKKGTKIASK